MRRKEALQRLGVSAYTFRRWVETGWIRPVRLPGRTYALYLTEDVERMEFRTRRAPVVSA